jgi:hypothetical protein
MVDEFQQFREVLFVFGLRNGDALKRTLECALMPALTHVVS